MRLLISMFFISLASLAFGQTERTLEGTVKKGSGRIKITSPITSIGTTPDPSPVPFNPSEIKLPDLPTNGLDLVSSAITNTSVADTSRVIQNLNSIRFSLGTYYNSNLETNIINAKQNFGISLQHNSNQIGVTNDWNSKRFNNNAYAWTRLNPFQQITFENSITYQNLGTYFYGNEDISTINLSRGNEITYNKWFYDGNLSNDDGDGPYKWNVSFGTNQLNGLQGLTEKNLNGGLDLKIPFENIPGFEIDLSGKFYKSIFNYSTIQTDRSIIYAQPGIYYKAKNFYLSAGINYISETQFESKSRVYPKFEFNYRVTKQHQIAAGLSGDVQFNTFSSLLKENIYLANNQSNFQNTDNPLQVYAIFKGGNSKENSAYSYQVKLKYATLNNLPAFVNGKRNTERDPLYFYVEYLGKNNPVSNFQIDATLYGKFNQEWSNTIYLKSDNYSGEIGYSNIIMRPSIDLTNKINYNGANWDFGLSIAYTSGLYGFQTKENRVVKMDDITLINLTGSYQFNESFRVYSNLNNLLNQKYQRIINYREIGFNFNAGILYEF